MKLEVLSVDDWPLVEEPVGSIRRSVRNTETSFILAGAAVICSAEGEEISVGPGDLVTVMPHTDCTWNITEAIERHYSNG